MTVASERAASVHVSVLSDVDSIAMLILVVTGNCSALRCPGLRLSVGLRLGTDIRDKGSKGTGNRV